MAQQQQQGFTNPYMLAVNESEMANFKDNIRDKVIHNLKKVLGDGDINFTGDLTKSIHKETASGIHFVYIDSPYAGLVDKGMSPGTRVNFDKLKAWVIGKLKISDEATNQFGKSFWTGEATDVTYKIFRKIERDGIKPTFFVKKALKKLIGKHGQANLRRSSGGNKQGKWAKKLKRGLKKAGKVLKKANKVLKKASKKASKKGMKGVKLANKGIKSANRGINKANKYQKKLGRYK